MKKLIYVFLFTSISLTVSACFWNVDLMHVFLRSDVITSPEEEARILAKARVGWTEDGRIRVLYLQGTPYERGYQHGKLLRKEVQENIGYMYRQALNTYKSKELFAEAYERIRPFIPQDYIEEMHGLAHGAKIPLEMVHHIHALPSMTEWGGKKELKKIFKDMLKGKDLGTSCSNFCFAPDETGDGEMYTVRILDWGLHKISKLHEYPLLMVSKEPDGHTSLVVSWVGFIGAVSGMNDQGITLGEMGYKDPPHETLRGTPMIFLLREVLKRAGSLPEVRDIISSHPGTNSFVYLMSDGKTGESELYVRDRTRFLVFQPGQDLKDNEEEIPGIEGILYAGHYNDRLTESLSKFKKKVTLEDIMKEIVPYAAMKSNFHNVIYNPTRLKIWVSNAAGPKERAAEQAYTSFDFAEAIASYGEASEVTAKKTPE